MLMRLPGRMMILVAGTMNQWAMICLDVLRLDRRWIWSQCDCWNGGMILNDRSFLNLFLLRHLIADMICDWHYRRDLSRTDAIATSAVLAAYH